MVIVLVVVVVALGGVVFVLVTGCDVLCKKPYFGGALPFGCGQCLPCRLNRRRVWTHRLLLEQTQHSESSFVTLTYASTAFPSSASLVPSDAQKWLKRLRKMVPGRRLRYFLVGEYGEHTFRPHYHAAIFGLGASASGIFDKSWGLGFVYVGDLTPSSAAYVCGYVTKKMTSSDDPRLGGRHPEFARMSLKPGLGAGAMGPVVDAVKKHGDLCWDGDVPTVLQHGTSKMPLGRYLRGRLRERVYDVAELQGVKDRALARYAGEVRGLFLCPRSKPENASASLSSIHGKLVAQKLLNLEARHRIFEKGRTL